MRIGSRSLYRLPSRRVGIGRPHVGSDGRAVQRITPPAALALGEGRARRDRRRDDAVALPVRDVLPQGGSRVRRVGVRVPQVNRRPLDSTVSADARSGGYQTSVTLQAREKRRALAGDLIVKGCRCPLNQRS